MRSKSLIQQFHCYDTENKGNNSCVFLSVFEIQGFHIRLTRLYHIRWFIEGICCRKTFLLSILTSGFSTFLNEIFD